MKFMKLDLEKHDISLVTELIFETDKNLFGTFLDKNRTIAITKLKKLIMAGNNVYGYENIFVAENQSKKIIGILVAYRGDELKFKDQAKIFKTTMKFSDFLKLTFLKPVYDRITSSRIEADDYYIGNLVVTQSLRSHGVGSEILKQSIKIASNKKCKRVLLDVIFENGRAKKFYKRNGFNICGVKNFKWLGKSEGTYGMEYLLICE